jgi:hypothetical protein
MPTSALLPKRRALASGLLLSVGLAFSAARGDERLDVLVKRAVWSGQLDALQRPHSPFAFALSPDGKRLLYYQGAPWPRLMVLELESPPAVPKTAREAEPRMVAAVAPFGALPPRWSPSGDTVYFTAVDRVETISLRAPSQRDLELYAARARPSDAKLERLHPLERRSDEFSVLLDVHPSGETVLIGSGRGFRGPDLCAAPIPLALLEVPAAGGPAAKLGFQVMSDSLVRYARAGDAVEYSQGPADDPGAELWRFERATRTHRATATRLGTLWRLAGARDVRSVHLPHRGSFGWDAFSRYEVAAPASGEGAAPQAVGDLRLDPSIATLAPFASVPIAFRGNRVLLCAGLADRPRLVLAEHETVKLDDKPVRPPRPAADAPFALPADFVSGAIACAQVPEARRLLECVQSALRGAGANAPAAVRVRWKRTDFLRLPVTTAELCVLEFRDGRIRIERTAEAQGDTAAASPAVQVSAFDGEDCWTRSGEGEVHTVSMELFRQQLHEASPMRLLFDPAGVGDPHLAFGAPRALQPAEAEGTDGAVRWALPFRYEDGFEGELIVGETEGGAGGGKEALPIEWRTPLLFPSEELRTQIGLVPATKAVRFESWRTFAGWRIPEKILFDDGYGSFRLELLEAGIPEKIEATAFVRPDS